MFLSAKFGFFQISKDQDIDSQERNVFKNPFYREFDFYESAWT